MMDEYNVWAGLDKQDTVDTSSQLSAAFSEDCGCQRTARRQWLILPSPRCWQGQPNCNLSTSNQERERQKEDIKVFSFYAVELRAVAQRRGSSAGARLQLGQGGIFVSEYNLYQNVEATIR